MAAVNCQGKLMQDRGRAVRGVPLVEAVAGHRTGDFAQERAEAIVVLADAAVTVGAVAVKSAAKVAGAAVDIATDPCRMSESADKEEKQSCPNAG
ncbi:MAG: hypothetical protein WBP72_17825 [Rhodocyclaceae bacterium]